MILVMDLKEFIALIKYCHLHDSKQKTKSLLHFNKATHRKIRNQNLIFFKKRNKIKTFESILILFIGQ